MGKFVGANGQTISYKASGSAMTRIEDACNITIGDMMSMDIKKMRLSFIARMLYEMSGGDKMFMSYDNFADNIFPPKMWKDEAIMQDVMTEFIDAWGFENETENPPEASPENGG